MVKIDGAFVENLEPAPDNQLFVRTLVELAKNFKLETVAEWVKSESDARARRLGLRLFSGLLLSVRRSPCRKRNCRRS